MDMLCSVWRPHETLSGSFPRLDMPCETSSPIQCLQREQCVQKHSEGAVSTRIGARRKIFGLFQGFNTCSSMLVPRETVCLCSGPGSCRGCDMERKRRCTRGWGAFMERWETRIRMFPLEIHVGFMTSPYVTRDSVPLFHMLQSFRIDDSTHAFSLFPSVQLDTKSALISKTPSCIANPTPFHTIRAPIWSAAPTGNQRTNSTNDQK